MELEDRYNKACNYVEDLRSKKSHVESTLQVAQGQMDKILKEQDLLLRSDLAMKQVKPLLSQSSILECEKLANAAISSVFDFPYKVKYSVEQGRFVLDKGDYETDLATAEGGGLLSVISFVFSVYLLIKIGKRKFLAFDEQFTQLSDEYLVNFLQFLVALCKDLNIDILLITHDGRIQLSQVDHAYRISDGRSIKEK